MPGHQSVAGIAFRVQQLAIYPTVKILGAGRLQDNTDVSDLAVV